MARTGNLTPSSPSRGFASGWVQRELVFSVYDSCSSCPGSLATLSLRSFPSFHSCPQRVGRQRAGSFYFDFSHVCSLFWSAMISYSYHIGTEFPFHQLPYGLYRCSQEDIILKNRVSANQLWQDFSSKSSSVGFPCMELAAIFYRTPHYSSETSSEGNPLEAPGWAESVLVGIKRLRNFFFHH